MLRRDQQYLAGWWHIGMAQPRAVHIRICLMIGGNQRVRLTPSSTSRLMMRTLLDCIKLIIDHVGSISAAAFKSYRGCNS
jgi:hypothetical protein